MMKFRFCLFFAVIFLPLLIARYVGGEEVRPLPDKSWKAIPKEPGWKAPSYRGWEVMSIPGLVATFYDLNLNGELDFMAIRKIARKASAEEIDLEDAVKLAKHDHMSLFVSHPVIYFTERYPMFYCLGLDYRRNCQNMWVDITEDGLNGNETLYTLSKPMPNVQ